MRSIKKRNIAEALVAMLALLLACLSLISENPIFNRSAAFTPIDFSINKNVTESASQLFSKGTIKKITESKTMLTYYLSAVSADDNIKLSVNNPPTTAPPNEAAKISVGATGPFQIKNETEETIAKVSGSNTVDISYYENTYFLLIDAKLISTSSDGFIVDAGSDNAIILPSYTDLNWNKTVNLNQFRGVIDIKYSKKSKKLWAVNELSLEDYLRGVSEAKADAPSEHLKVMAIVERSYAWHHIKNGGKHEGEPFILKNSRGGNGDDQIYQGYLAELRLPTIVSAAVATRGSVVTYLGDPVITPYSSNPGGRTLSPQEAGWGNLNWPWVKSVPDPDTAGMVKNGHGVGLSGVGSLKRAERGEKNENILGYYFPGTSIGQVPSDSVMMRVAIYGVEG